ncbi:hypothetical protein [Luteococcus peritonei]|uniref:Type IV toxin-antitoxin system AbiEi family antitoxin domain-containing protein n=1 Tax=Luteococcus peritonei TaxID=88874 RepID=A0ABW4RZR3_9ACTN
MLGSACPHMQSAAVHHTVAVPDELVRLAHAQAGVITREQACHWLSVDVLRRLLTKGTWARLSSGVYLTHAGEPSRAACHWAALLAGGQGACLALHTAAELWDLEEPSTPLQVHLPYPARRAAVPGVEFRSTRRPIRSTGTLARTTLASTVLDLCEHEPERALSVVTKAVNRGIPPARLRQELALYRRMPGRRLLDDLLEDVQDGAVSPLELRYLRDVERAHGLPRGQRQHVRRGRIRDVKYGALLVELDGRLGHTGEGAFRDMYRDNEHLLGGEFTLRFGWWDCEHRPCETAWVVHRGLLMVGERSEAHGCRRCSNVTDWWGSTPTKL